MTRRPLARFLALAALCGGVLLVLKFGPGAVDEDRGDPLEPGRSSSPATVPVPSGAAPDGTGRRALRPLPPSAAMDEEPTADVDAQPDPRQAGEDMEHLLARAPGILDGESSDAEKVALLRALHELGYEGTDELILHFLLELPDSAPSGRVSVPSSLIRYLGDRGLRNPNSRALLERAVWPDAGALNDDLRRRAASYLAAVVGPQDLARLSSRLRQERDEKLVEGALVTLAHNRHAQAPPEFFRALGYEPPEVDDVDEGDG